MREMKCGFSSAVVLKNFGNKITHFNGFLNEIIPNRLKNFVENYRPGQPNADSTKNVLLLKNPQF